MCCYCALCTNINMWFNLDKLQDKNGTYFPNISSLGIQISKASFVKDVGFLQHRYCLNTDQLCITKKFLSVLERHILEKTLRGQNYLQENIVPAKNVTLVQHNHLALPFHLKAFSNTEIFQFTVRAYFV